MEECNSTTYKINVPVCIVESVCVVNTLFLSFVISWTPSLKGFSGVLLLNEQVASFIQHTSNIVLLCTVGVSSIYKIAHVLMPSAHSVTIFLLFLININLCLAVCKGAAYKRLVTWKRVAVIIITTWILGFVVGFLPFSYVKFAWDCDNMRLRLVPNSVTGLRTLGYLLEGGFIMIGSIVILFKVRYQRKRVQPDYTLRSVSDTVKKMKLLRLTFVMVMVQAATFTYIQLLPYTLNSEEARSIAKVLSPFVFYLSRIYGCFRFCFYLSLYTPMWETTKSLLSCRKRNGTRNTTIVSSAHQGQTQQNNVSPDRRDAPLNIITPVQFPGDTANTIVSDHTPGDVHNKGIISVQPIRDISQSGLMSFQSGNTSKTTDVSPNLRD